MAADKPQAVDLESDIAIWLRDAMPTRHEFEAAKAAAVAQAVEGRRQERNARAAAKWAARWAVAELEAIAAEATRKLHAAYHLQKAEGWIDPRLVEFFRDLGERVVTSANPVAEAKRVWGPASGHGAPSTERPPPNVGRDFWITVYVERRIAAGATAEAACQDLTKGVLRWPGKSHGGAEPKVETIGRIHRLHRDDPAVRAQLSMERTDARNLTTAQGAEAIRDFFSDVAASRAEVERRAVEHILEEAARPGSASTSPKARDEK